MKKIKLASSFSGVSINEKLIQLFLEDGNKYEKHLRKINRAYQNNIAVISDLFQRHVSRIVQLSRPQGGFCIWVEFDSDMDSYSLYNQLIARNIAISLAIFSKSHRYKNFIRVNCGIPMDDKIEKSIETIGEVVAAMDH